MKKTLKKDNSGKETDFTLERKKKILILLVALAMVGVFILWFFVFFPKSKQSLKIDEKAQVGKIVEEARERIKSEQEKQAAAEAEVKKREEAKNIETKIEAPDGERPHLPEATDKK